jgi:hypothetical protein
MMIKNDGTVEQYQRKIDDALRAFSGPDRKIEYERAQRPESELHRCLQALEKLGRTATCDEIASMTGKLGVSVRRYNTNRALKGAPEFANRVEKSGKLLSYRITPQGRELLRFLSALRSVHQ